ncbi:MAG TPA: Fe-S cluster assembly protein SufD [Longimicrobium sp.]|nr:Fe-S cluster assembly protein SufD [Longimicrobium sp.]
MSDITTAADIAANVGPFTRDQVEILSTRKVEGDWLRAARLASHGAFAAAPMPSTRLEEWRYTDIARALKLEALSFAEERAAVTSIDALPAELAAVVRESGETSARLAQVDASMVYREVPADLAAQGVIFTSLESAAREHPELVAKYLGSALTPDDGKFAAMSGAFWSGGVFVYVPKDARVEVPVRVYRAITEGGTTVFGRTLVVAEAGAEVAVVDETVSPDFERQALSVSGAEIFAEEGAKVTYVSVQRWGRGVAHLSTDRLVAGRDATITTLYTALGADLARADVQCRLKAPGAHVDMLGVYVADGGQHFDHETLQDHVAPHASSNLLFKGALNDEARSVFRGLIRVHPKAQRTDAYQTNRNLILSDRARADSLPNLEIQADDVRCSHAATVGQLDAEELFYLLSRGIHRAEAVRLVVFGFFAEVLEQLPLEGVRGELLRAVERKLAARA